tara:strand:+ start:159 stop:323 length:165 start_codon:yes stop_codon:yes gene_type:complete
MLNEENPNSKLDPQSELREQIQVQPEETFRFGPFEVTVHSETEEMGEWVEVIDL